jgi:hypothetical protein
MGAFQPHKQRILEGQSAGIKRDISRPFNGEVKSARCVTTDHSTSVRGTAHNFVTASRWPEVSVETHCQCIAESLSITKQRERITVKFSGTKSDTKSDPQVYCELPTDPYSI